MKTALIIESIIIVALLVILALKWRKWTISVAQEDKFEISPGEVQLDRYLLEDFGFKIYGTKDKTYALHQNGLSMTWVEGTEWIIEDPHTRRPEHIFNVGGLLSYAGRHDKKLTIKQEDK